MSGAVRPIFLWGMKTLRIEIVDGDYKAGIETPLDVFWLLKISTLSLSRPSIA